MKNVKLRSKKALVIILAIVLLAACFCTSTFSWFPRPKYQYEKGKELQVNVPDTSYYIRGSSTLQTGAPYAYDGSGLKMVTSVSNDDGINFYELNDLPPDMTSTTVLPYTSYTLGTSSTSNPINRIYYKTEIINYSTDIQNVSLYIKNFKPGSDGNVCVGTNVPVKSFKNYSMYGITVPAATTNKKNTTTKRVYFEPWGAIKAGNYYDEIRNIWKNASSYYVVSGGSSTDIDANNGSNGVYTQMIDTGYDSANNYSHTKIFYADIPWNHNKLYFTVNDWNGNSIKRTQTFTNLTGDGLSTTQSKRYYLNGDRNDYNNAKAYQQDCKGASIASFYDKATLYYNPNVPQSVSVALSSSEYQCKSGSGGFTYTSNGTGFTFDTSTGVITATGSGSGTVTYTATSEYGDTKTENVTVKVEDKTNSNTVFKSAPIVTNLLIPAANTENQINSDGSNVQDVYWFIQNGDSMYGTANRSGTYELDGLYLGV